MKRRTTNQETDLRRQQLLDDLRKTKYALDCAYSNFENVVDPDLIDCSIYELKAVQMRYRFLLKQAELLDSAT
ncbi:MAG: YaaL family protein [Lachnospiraceae bacterium]|nr:YaaL family protein [Lachnospiraceae bacterium]